MPAGLFTVLAELSLLLAQGERVSNPSLFLVTAKKRFLDPFPTMNGSIWPLLNLIVSIIII